MHHERQTCLSRSLANLREDFRAEHGQVLIVPEAALEVGLDANPAGLLYPLDRRSWAVILWLVFRWNARRLPKIIDEVGKEFEACCWRRKRHGVTISNWQGGPTVI